MREVLFQLLTDLSKAFDSSYSGFAEILFGVPRGFFCFCFLEIDIDIANYADHQSLILPFLNFRKQSILDGLITIT